MGTPGEGPGGEDNGLSGIYTNSLHLPVTLQAVIRGMHLREGLVSVEGHCRPRHQEAASPLDTG